MKATVEMADICAICKDGNSPDPDMEGEDTWVGGDRVTLVGDGSTHTAVPIPDSW